MRGGDDQSGRVARGRRLDHIANAVDVAGDDVPAQFVAQPERLLEVECCASVPQRGGAADAFARDVDREPSVAGAPAAIDHGQAHARTGDRGADRDPRRVERAGDRHAQVAALLDAADGADRGDYPGEHESLSLSASGLWRS